MHIQRRAHQLLQWINDALPDGRVAFPSSHQADSPTLAAAAWIRANQRLFLGSEESLDPETVRQCGNMLSSFLLTTYEFVEDPRVNGLSPNGCGCPCCRRLVPGQHLRRRKPTKLDRRRARERMVDTVQSLATDGGIPPVSGGQLASAFEDRVVAQAAALVAYGHQLLDRLEDRGEDGAVALVLWRQFAWTPQGSPRPGFELDADLILRAERELDRWLRSLR